MSSDPDKAVAIDDRGNISVAGDHELDPAPTWSRRFDGEEGDEGVAARRGSTGARGSTTGCELGIFGLTSRTRQRRHRCGSGPDG